MSLQNLQHLLLSKTINSRENRIKASNIIINDNSLFLPLLQIVFDFDAKISTKAGWVLEYVLKENLNLLIPHLDYFTANISRVHFDSSVRPLAKICELLAKSYTNRSELIITNSLNQNHITPIVETSFDWMISDYKVAVKAYSMETLFLFGKEINWVHPELKLILQQEIANGSPAYKARGKKILKWIEKLEAGF